jgi:hypothetical protein
MTNSNLADVGKCPGSARQAGAHRDMRSANRPAVTLTPDEVRKLERALGAKATAVVRALRAAGLVGAAKAAAKDRGPVSPLGGLAQ